jgi:hypothetical protein
MEITPVQADALIRAMKGGADLETACDYAGVSVGLVYKALERGKVAYEQANNGGVEVAKSEEPYLLFWDNLKKSRADAIVRNVAHIQQAAQNGSWQAAAWWLERTVPQTYAKKTPNSQQVESHQKSSIEG